MGNCKTKSKSTNISKTTIEDSINKNDNVIQTIRAQVNSLLERIHEFEGTSEQDKNYKYLDEMLTRCILDLDQIECNNVKERDNRRETIRSVNAVISILERKLAINSDIRSLEINLNENCTS